MNALFEILDSDHDGFISLNKINIEGLTEDVFKCMYPLLLEIEQRNIEVSKNTFSEGALSYINSLTPYEKKILRN